MINTPVIWCLLQCVVGAQPMATEGGHRLVNVLRYHPYILDNLDARRHDSNLILKEWGNPEKRECWKGPGISHLMANGGFGRGFTVSISRDEIPAWKKMIDHLHKEMRFRY